MTPTRNEAAERLRDEIHNRVETVEQRGLMLDLTDMALAAEREPLLAALEELLRVGFKGEDFLTQNGIPMDATPGVRRAVRKARALIEQDGRRGLKADPFDRGLTEPQP